MISLKSDRLLHPEKSDKGFKGIGVNRAKAALDEGSLEITLTVPLIQFAFCLYLNGPGNRHTL